MINKKEITNGLKKLGLSAGDHVIVHSALTSLGKVEGGAESVIDAILDVIGEKGTLVVPTFGCPDKIFDAKKSETNLGAIPQLLWKRKGAFRSNHPLASVAALGAKSKWLIEGHENARLAHGPGTPYYRLAELGGKILLLGVDQDRNTFLHTIEEMAELDYLRTWKATYLNSKGKAVTKEWPYFPGPHRNFIGMQSWLEESGLVTKTRIGNCVAQLMPMKPLMKALEERIRKEPSLYLSQNPNMADGVWQNADVYKAAIKKETFTLCADSAYCGKYMEELIENCKRSGIENVILSFVNNVPWEQIETKQRKWYLQGLKEAGIKVKAIKIIKPDEKITKAILKEAGGEFAIIDSTAPAEKIKKLLAAGLSIYIENIRTKTEDLLAHLSDIGNKNIKLAFNPLEFAQAGENPFLYTYTKTQAKRHIGLLYINDGLATGERTELENGLSEIKELISILRCKSFDGLFVLQPPKACDFISTAQKFMSMLKELGEVPSK